jgi:ATP-dependent Clp protease ATP-binding subunit ClpA
MFERFTREARAAVSTAVMHARRAGAERFDTRHLLLALLEGSGPRAALWDADANAGKCVAALERSVSDAGLDAEALASIGVDLEAITHRIDAVFGPDALRRGARQDGRPKVAPDVKKALQLALREAVRLRDRSIDAHHLMLGILRADCPGRRILDHYVDLGRLRQALEGRAAA